MRRLLAAWKRRQELNRAEWAMANALSTANRAMRPAMKQFRINDKRARAMSRAPSRHWLQILFPLYWLGAR